MTIRVIIIAAALSIPTAALAGPCTARIAELALKHRVPSVFEFAFQVEAGAPVLRRERQRLLRQVDTTVRGQDP